MLLTNLHQNFHKHTICSQTKRGANQTQILRCMNVNWNINAIRNANRNKRFVAEIVCFVRLMRFNVVQKAYPVWFNSHIKQMWEKKDVFSWCETNKDFSANRFFILRAIYDDVVNETCSFFLPWRILNCWRFQFSLASSINLCALVPDQRQMCHTLFFRVEIITTNF